MLLCGIKTVDAFTDVFYVRSQRVGRLDSSSLNTILMMVLAIYSIVIFELYFKKEKRKREDKC